MAFQSCYADSDFVAGTTRYTIPTGTQHVDYETFRISKDSTLASPGVALKQLEYNEYVEKFIDQEDDDSYRRTARIRF